MTDPTAPTPPEGDAQDLPLGTAVYAWPGTKDVPPMLTRTRSSVWLIGDKHPVVQVEGHAGGISLSHILRRPDDELAPEPTDAAGYTLGPVSDGGMDPRDRPEPTDQAREQIAEVLTEHSDWDYIGDEADPTCHCGEALPVDESNTFQGGQAAFRAHQADLLASRLAVPEPSGQTREQIENGESGDTWAYVVTDGPKMLRETLCVAQNRIRAVDDPRNGEHSERLGRLINECDRHRPLGNDCKHGNRHTPTCGCEDKSLAVHVSPETAEERDPWPFGIDAACRLVAAAGNPNERVENRDSWAVTMPDRPDVFAIETVRARKRLEQAIAAIARAGVR